MPSLTPEEQRYMLGATTIECSVCKQPMSRGYCREDDEFYLTCACPNKKTGHENHRTY